MGVEVEVQKGGGTHVSLEVVDVKFPGGEVTGFGDKILEGAVGGSVHQEGPFEAWLVLGDEGLVD